MITAKTARKLVEEIKANPMHFQDLKEEIEFQVKKAIHRSESSCYILCYLPNDIVKWLHRLGYTVERYEDDPKGGDFSTISW